MTHEKITAFVALLRSCADAGTLRNVTFHAPVPGDALKCRGTLCAIGGKTFLQLETLLTEGRVTQENAAPEDLAKITERLFDTFHKADLTDAGSSASLMISKKGTVTLLQKGSVGKVYAAANPLPRQGNDRVKKRLLTGAEPFLTALGISDKTGRVHDKMQSKFRQIARFAEYVAEAEQKLGGTGPLTVCDLCCGKSYLSFAAYYVLTALAGREVKMYCVDRKASVMETCAGIAKEAGFRGMEFLAMDIGDFDPGCAPDLVLSLHACDTATDLVLDYASKKRAKIILSTPCCQQELSRALDCPTLGFIASVPVLRQKFAATATDALRLLKLEAEGYKTDATEFVDPDDTPKNVMLRAVLRRDFDPSSPDAKTKRERYLRTRAFLYGDDYRGHEPIISDTQKGCTMNTNELLTTISRTDIPASMRLDALRGLRAKIDAGEIETPARGIFVNNHIHTSYSFSPYTPTSAVFYAWKAGLRTAGIMDHDSVGGMREFIEAGAIMQMPITCGFECRVNVDGTPLVGQKVNNPDQNSCAYLAMHGIPHTQIDAAEAVLAGLREKRNERNRKMVERINALVASAGIVLDFDRDVVPLSMAHEGGSVTERHICMGLAKKITSAYPDRAAACDFLDTLTGAPMNEKTRSKLLDAPENFYEYDILGVLKGHLVEKFYVDATDECMNIRDFTALAKKLGAVSAYAYLGDVGESPTGDKKAQKFEDDYLDELFDTLADCGFDAVTYMPSRNTKAQLERVMDLCHARGLYQISGEDINSPRQSFICEALADYPHLFTATYALIGQEIAATEDLSRAMFSDATKKAYPDLDERVAVYAKIGGIDNN